MRHKQRVKLREQAPLPFLIESLSHEGRGVAHYGQQPEHNPDKHGKTVFVAFALPGEQVSAKVVETNKRFEEADAITVSNPSPDRVAPVCAHFGVCGGCSLQHLAVDAQVAFKQQMLAEQFAHFGGLVPEQWVPPLRSARTDYRRKARLGVRYVPQKGRTLIGFRERRSAFLAELSHCRVLDAQIGERIEVLRDLLTALSIREQIPQIEIAIGDDGVAIIVRHMVPMPEADQAALLAFCRELGWQLYLQPGGYDTVHRLDAPDAPHRLHYELPEFGVRFAFSPLDFTQVNAGVNRQMVQQAVDWLALQPGERVLDLFCGLGNFSLPLARRVGPTGQVVAVEGSTEMVERGSENALANGLSNVQFFAQDLTRDFSAQPWAAQGFDALLIDPPRSGAEAVMQYLPRFGARRLVYVSCNPATLARDAGILAQSGYVLKKAGVMDMFTHTGHVESMALFEKARG